MNIYKKLLNNSMIFALGTFGPKVISLFLLPLYTYYLTPSEYGIVDLITVTISLLIPIITVSIIDSILRFVMDKNYDKEAVLINSVVISIVGLLILILAYPILYIVLPFQDFILYFYLILIVQILNTLLAQYVRAKGMVKLFAISGILTSILLLVGNLFFLVFLDLSILGYLLAFIVAYSITGIFIFFVGNINKDFDIRKIDIELMKEMLIFSIPLIPNTLMWWIMGVSDRYMISYFLGLSSTGLYAVAVRIPSILNIVNSVFFQAWQMSAIEEADSKDRSQFFTNVFNVFSIVMLTSTSLILMLLKPIMAIIVDDSFFESWRYVPFLLLGIVFSSFSGFLGTNYIASKKTGGVFKTSVIGAAINLTINLILIPLVGINGATIGTMLSFLAVWLLRIKDTKQFVTIKISTIKLVMTFSVILLQILLLYLGLSIEYILHSIFVVTIILINRKQLKIIISKLRKIAFLKK